MEAEIAGLCSSPRAANQRVLNSVWTCKHKPHLIRDNILQRSMRHEPWAKSTQTWCTTVHGA